jgi:outer membrane cobalamin receptor
LEFLENTAGQIWEVANQKDVHATTVRGLDLQFDKQLLEAYRLVCGFSDVKNMNDSTFSAKHEYSVTAGYLENHLDLFNNKLNLNLSARLDDYSNLNTEFNPSLSASYQLNDDLKFHGLISRSFRAPTFNDLYWPFDGWEQGNPNLLPEKGISEELGVETKINKYVTSGLAYYHSDYSQLIQWSDDGTGIWRPVNVNSATIDGWESQNKIYILDNLDLNLNYTYLMARDAKTHKYLVYQPRNKVDTSLKFHDHNGLTMELRGQFTAQRFADAGNNTKVKNFFVFGISVAKKFNQGFTCFGSIDNLFNRKYQVINDYPMPGFSFTGGLKAEF